MSIYCFVLPLSASLNRHNACSTLVYSVALNCRDVQYSNLWMIYKNGTCIYLVKLIEAWQYMYNFDQL